MSYGGEFVVTILGYGNLGGYHLTLVYFCLATILFNHCNLVQRQFSDRHRDVLMNVRPLISGGPLLSLRCSARVHHRLRSLMRVVDWCVSRLVRLICCRIILTASSKGRLLIRRSLVIHLLVLPPFAFRSSEVRRLLLDLDPYGGTGPLGMFPLFLRELLMLWPPS